MKSNGTEPLEDWIWLVPDGELGIDDGGELGERTEEAIVQPEAAQEFPDALNRIEFRAVGRQEQQVSRVTSFPEDDGGFGHGVSGDDPKSPVRSVVSRGRVERAEWRSAGSYFGSGSRTSSAGRCWSRSLGTNSMRMPQPA